MLHLLTQRLGIAGTALSIAPAAGGSSQSFTRQDVRIASQGLKMGGWLYAPNGLKDGEKRPTIVGSEPNHHGLPATGGARLYASYKGPNPAGMRQ